LSRSLARCPEDPFKKKRRFSMLGARRPLARSLPGCHHPGWAVPRAGRSAERAARQCRRARRRSRGRVLPRPPPRLRRPPSRARSFSRARCTRATPAVPWLHPEPRVHTAPLPIPAPPCLRASVRGYIHVPTAWPAQLTPDNLTVAGAGAFAGAGAGVGVHRSAGMCGG
jgi:hypothetical protein